MRALALALLVVLAASGCSEKVTVTIYRDRPVTLDGSAAIVDMTGDPTLILGLNEGNDFELLEDGGAAQMIHGLQGGYWIHLALRVTAMERAGRFTASLRRDSSDGDVLGEVGFDLRLSLTSEDHYEAALLPIPLDPTLTADRIGRLDGAAAHMAVSFTAGERAASAERAVVLRSP